MKPFSILTSIGVLCVALAGCNSFASRSSAPVVTDTLKEESSMSERQERPYLEVTDTPEESVQLYIQSHSSSSSL